MTIEIVMVASFEDVVNACRIDLVSQEKRPNDQRRRIWGI